MPDTLRSVSLFVLAALAEIGGAWYQLEPQKGGVELTALLLRQRCRQVGNALLEDRDALQRLGSRQGKPDAEQQRSAGAQHGGLLTCRS